jgi:exopolysaccharide biosynthesis polyprenyl glycosylphosphotransferase
MAACAPAAVGTHLLLRLALPGSGAGGTLWLWLWLSMGAATVATHQLWAWVARLPRQRPVRNVVIVGTGARAQRRFADLCRDAETSYNVIGFVDANVASDLPAWESPILGGVGDLERILSEFVIDEVHIALPVKSRYDDFEAAIRTCAAVGVQAVYPLDAFEVQTAYPRLECARAVPDVRLKVVPHADDLIHKRVLDILLSSAALLVLSPVLLAVAAAVKLSSPGPVIFSQQRYGKHRRPFRLYKFRSMRADSEEVLRTDPELYAEYVRNNYKLPQESDPRLTPIGAFIRRTSLDELPQLWNVLKGDMAIVGPRPIIEKEIAWYGPLSSLLLAVKPGLVGAWVTAGRSHVGYPQRTDLELGYVKRWSLEQDLRIMARAVPAVLSGRGAH